MKTERPPYENFRITGLILVVFSIMVIYMSFYETNVIAKNTEVVIGYLIGVGGTYFIGLWNRLTFYGSIKVYTKGEER